MFRLIALENRAAKLPAAKDVAEATYRALFHPKKEGFKRFVFDKMEPAGPIPEGEVDPRTMIPGILTLPVRRLLPTVRKTIRGLYYKIKGRPLPPEYVALAFLMETLVENLPESELMALRGVVQNLLSQPAVEVGEGVFQYRTFSEDDDPNEMHFLLVFYNRFIFYGFIASEVKYRDMEDKVDRS